MGWRKEKANRDLPAKQLAPLSSVNQLDAWILSLGVPEP